MHPFVHSLSPLAVVPDVPVFRLVKGMEQLPAQAGLLSHFPRRRLLRLFAFLDDTLGQLPHLSAARENEANFRVLLLAAVDDATG